jgi:hypothetical protein
VPGSVIDPREPARALLVGARVDQVGEHDVGGQHRAGHRGADAGARRLLGEHDVEAPVIDARAAVLLGDLHRVEAVLGAFLEELARHDLRLLPLPVVRHDLRRQEGGVALAVIVVLVVEQLAAGRGHGDCHRWVLSCWARGSIDIFRMTGK